ncbi:MAG: tetratricopeptide repeat protein [Gammaproteobacteria bacterium]
MKKLGHLLILSFIVSVAACMSPEDRAERYLRKAQEYLDADDQVRAGIEARNAAQIEPRNAEVRLILATLAEQKQAWSDAIGHLLVAVDEEPDNLDARIRLGTLYFLARANERAAVQSAAANEIAPDDTRVRLLKARINYRQGDIAGALADVNVALAAEPTFIDAIMFKAGVLAVSEDWDESMETVNVGISEVDLEDSKPLRQFRVQLLAQLERADEVESELIALARDFPEEDAYRYALVRLYLESDDSDRAEQMMREIADEDPSDSERQLRLARYLAGQKSFDAAEEFLMERIRTQPDSESLQLALGMLYESNERDEQALEVFGELADKSPRTEDGLVARNRIVSLRLQGGDLDLAREAAEAILNDAPDNVDALLSRAAFSFADQDYDSAIADLRVLLRNQENSLPALFLLARSHVGAGDAVLAADAYRRLLAINPNIPEATTELAGLMSSQGDTSGAEELLRERLETAPGDATAAAELITTLLARDEIEVAETEARKLVEITEGNALAQLQLGRVMSAKDSPEEAIAAYKQTLTENPAAVSALRELTALLVRSNRADEAIDFLQQHRAQNPEVAEARFLEGAAHASIGAFDAARAAYRDFLAEEPSSPRAYIGLATLTAEGSTERLTIVKEGFAATNGNEQLGLVLASIYEKQEQWDETIDTYEKIIDNNPGSLIAKNNLAALLLDVRSDDASKARAVGLAMELRDSDQPAFLDTVGWAYYRQGDIANAVPYLERAVAAAEQVPALRYHLGMAYAAAGNIYGARAELSRAIREGTEGFIGIDDARAKLAELDDS